LDSAIFPIRKRYSPWDKGTSPTKSRKAGVFWEYFFHFHNFLASQIEIFFRQFKIRNFFSLTGLYDQAGSPAGCSSAGARCEIWLAGASKLPRLRPVIRLPHQVMRKKSSELLQGNLREDL